MGHMRLSNVMLCAQQPGTSDIDIACFQSMETLEDEAAIYWVDKNEREVGLRLSNRGDGVSHSPNPHTIATE